MTTTLTVTRPTNRHYSDLIPEDMHYLLTYANILPYFLYYEGETRPAFIACLITNTEPLSPEFHLYILGARHDYSKFDHHFASIAQSPKQDAERMLINILGENAVKEGLLIQEAIQERTDQAYRYHIRQSFPFEYDEEIPSFILDIYIERKLHKRHIERSTDLAKNALFQLHLTDYLKEVEESNFDQEDHIRS